MNTTEEIKFFAVYVFECFDKEGKLKWREEIKNLVPTVGRNKFLDATLKTGLASPAWFIGLKNNGAPAAGDTMASHATWTEITSYTEGTRQALTLGAIANGSVDNTGAKATFTMNATVTVGGGFITDVNTKGGATGTLLSATNFTGGDKPVDSGDSLVVTSTFNANAG